MRSLVLIALSLVVLAAVGHARAEELEALQGSTASGLCGLFETAQPTCRRSLTLGANLGYGRTQLDGVHQRLIGDFGVGLVPLEWLAVSLELKGRFDFHPDDAQGKDRTGTGDPVLRVRLGHKLGRGVSLGGEVGVWMPGTQAPSLVPSATTVDLRGLFAYTQKRFQLLGTLGARLDQSAQSAPPRDRIRDGDRVSLGLSDSHALLAGVGAAYAVRDDLALYTELSAQLLLGKQAPSLLESPIRVAAGLRYVASTGLQLELSVVPSLSRRPQLGADIPLVPVEPRVRILLGIRYAFLPKPPAPVAAPSAPSEDTLPSFVTELQGVLTDPSGAPLPDASVQLTQGEMTRRTRTDAEGRYRFEELPMGEAELRAEAPGFKSETWKVSLDLPSTQLTPRTLAAADNTGTLRCLVRSYQSEALRATVRVRDTNGAALASLQTNPDGTLEIPLPPGQYRIMIEMPGYRGQQTSVRIAANEVAILNVDLRKVR